VPNLAAAVRARWSQRRLRSKPAAELGR
jgi:hypothetical protein